MRILKGLLLGGVALIGISFLVPKYETSPQSSREKLVEARLSASGEQLLLRTREHDYEFSLPQNRLSEAFAQSETLPSRLLGDNPGTAMFDHFRVGAGGTVSTNFALRFGGYDSRLSETKTVLSEATRKHLQELGFSPSNGNVVGDIEPALYMAWDRDLVGRQYPVFSKGSYSGSVIRDGCCFDVEVEEDDTIKLARNHRINSALAPLHAIREYAERLLFLPMIYLILFFTGFRPGA